MTKAVVSFLVAFLMLVQTPALFAQSGDRAVDDTRGAMEFIEQLANDTIAVWSDQLMNKTEREEAFRQIFLKASDVRLLAQAMLGRHYRTASKEQRQAYMTVMTEYIVTEFGNRMTQIGFKDVKVTGTTPAPGRRGHLWVKTEVDRDEGSPLLADWRVRKTNGTFQVVNLEVEGINLVITTREYFASRIKELGGLDQLIAELERDYITNKADTEAMATETSG